MFLNIIKTWIKNENNFIINKVISQIYDISQILYLKQSNIISLSNSIDIWEEINDNYQLVSKLIDFKRIKSILIIEDKNILILTGKIWNLFFKFNYIWNNCFFESSWMLFL